MVWGCFSYAGTGDLYRVKGILERKGYHSILKNHAVPSGKRLIGKGFVFQQDNDPKHTSKLCSKYLETKHKYGELRIMQWPPQSSDLNPIELLWDEMDRQVRKVTNLSAEKLWDFLQKCWKETPREIFEKLVERMPRVVKSVLSARGGFFDETRVQYASKKINYIIFLVLRLNELCPEIHRKQSSKIKSQKILVNST